MKKLLLLLMTASLTGCAAEKPTPTVTPPGRQFITADEKTYADQQFAVYDPIAGTNKEIYKFNAEFDEYVFLPVVEGYKFVTPQFLRDRITLFFANVGEFGNFTNSVLQAKPPKSCDNAWAVRCEYHGGPAWHVRRGDRVGHGAAAGRFRPDAWRVGVSATGRIWFCRCSGLLTCAIRPARSSICSPSHGWFRTLSRTARPMKWWITAFAPVDMRYRNDFRYYHSGSAFEYEFVRYIRKNARDNDISK